MTTIDLSFVFEDDKQDTNPTVPLTKMSSTTMHNPSASQQSPGRGKNKRSSFISKLRWSSRESPEEKAARKAAKKAAYSEAQLEKARKMVAKLKAYGPTDGKVLTEEEREARRKQKEEDARAGTYQPPSLVLSESSTTEPAAQDASQAKAPGKLFEVFYDVESHGFGFELLASTPSEGIKIYSVKQWGPAAEVGVVVGSIVTEVNGVNVSGLQYADIVTMINSSNQNLRIRLLPPSIASESEDSEIPVDARNGGFVDIPMSPEEESTQEATLSSPPQSTPAISSSPMTVTSTQARNTSPAQRSPSKGFSLSSLGQRSAKPTKRVPDLTPQKSTHTKSRETQRGADLKDDDEEMSEIALLPVEHVTTASLAKPFPLTRATKGNADGTEAKPSKWEKVSNGNFKENGVQLKLVGSKVHTKHMGIYAELDSVYNKTPVYQHRSSEKPYFLYYTDKAWKISSVVGKKKCIFSTNSPPTRPDKVRSIWYEARGPRLSAMQGHPSIKAILVDEEDCNIIKAGARSAATKSKGAAKAQDRIRRRLTLS
eukprot:m.125795 g.125795  ORF g.125795 m.125795 type:complete len:541 (-) comp17340_c0_seq2:335-1957(-)